MIAAIYARKSTDRGVGEVARRPYFFSRARLSARSIAGSASGAWTSARARKPRASVTKPVKV